jgi:hypothetical protein
LIPNIIPYSFLHPSLCEAHCFILPGFIFISFSNAHSPTLFKSYCNLSMSLLSFILLYIIKSSAYSRILDSAFLQISLTQARKSRGTNTLPCRTSDVTLAFSDGRPSALTLCERTTTLKSNPVSALFVSSLSRGTKSKAFEKSITFASVLNPSSS